MEKILVLTFIFCFSFLTTSYAQWELRYPELPEDKITSVKFLSKTTGFFVNEAGAIYRTTNGGESWEEVFYDGNSRFSSIQFIDNEVGFAYAYYGSCFTYTTDGGKTWKQDDLDVHVANSVVGFSPSEFLKTDENGIYKTSSVFGSWQKIYEVPVETIDGGDLLWEQPIAVPKNTYQLSDSTLSILYYNRYRGDYENKADSLYYLLNTTNRGATWDSVWIKVEGKIISFDMVDQHTGFILTEKGDFYRTDNGATSWNQKIIPSSEISPHTIVTFSKDRIYLKGLEAFKTTDGGESWEILQVPENGFNTGYIISRFNHSAIHDLQLKVNEDGEEWVHGKQFQRIGGAKLYFKNKTTGWTFKEWSFSKRTAFKTDDGGYSWVADTTFPEYPYEINYISEDQGWFMGREKIYKTDDGGKNWTALDLLDTEENLYDAHILFDGEFGIIYTNINCEDLSCGYLFITNDSGTTWESRSVPVYFESLTISEGEIFGVGDDKKLWASADKGLNWKVTYDFSYQNLSPKPLVRSINDMVWLNIGSNSLAYSKDGGESWNTTSASVDEDMALIGPFSQGNYYLYVPDHGNITQINSQLGIYDKRDQLLHTNVGIEDIEYVLDENNDPHIWLRGNINSTILYRKGPLRVQVSNEEKDSELPTRTTLFQNYPNPFNPVTTFSFDLEKPENVKLSVYNLAGQEVAIVINNRLSSGSHSINFNARHLASGTYIYRLETANKLLSKKFTLIK